MNAKEEERRRIEGEDDGRGGENSVWYSLSVDLLVKYRG